MHPAALAELGLHVDQRVLRVVKDDIQGATAVTGLDVVWPRLMGGGGMTERASLDFHQPRV